MISVVKVTDLQDEMKRKEQRWTSSTTRLRDRIEQLEQENTELRDEVKILEKRRFEEWQQREGTHTAANNVRFMSYNTPWLVKNMALNYQKLQWYITKLIFFMPFVEYEYLLPNANVKSCQINYVSSDWCLAENNK